MASDSPTNTRNERVPADHEEAAPGLAQADLQGQLRSNTGSPWKTDHPGEKIALIPQNQAGSPADAGKDAAEGRQAVEKSEG